jgi:hypothetical protein
MNQFDRHCCAQGEVERCAEGSGGRNAEAGPECPPATAWVIGKQIVEIPPRFSPGKVSKKELPGGVTILV